MAPVFGLLLLLSSWLASTGVLGQAPAGPSETPGLEAPVTQADEHVALLAPYVCAPGRPSWAPLEAAWGDTQDQASLEAALREGPAADRARAALGLALTGAQGSRALLAQIKESAAGEARLWAGLALCYLGDARGLPEARRALNSGPVWARYYALVGLWRLDSPEVRAFVRASEPAQGPFLANLIPLLLQSAPWIPPAAPAGPPQTSAPTESAQIWERLADKMVLVSDYWWHEGDYDQCTQAMEAAVFFCPDRVDLFDNIAWLQWSLGRDAVAIDALERAIASNPDSWLAQYNLGFHYFNTKRYEQALPYLRAAATSCDTWWVPAHIYAHALEYTKRPQEALRVWEDCVKRFPKDDSGWRNLERLRKSLAEAG